MFSKTSVTWKLIRKYFNLHRFDHCDTEFVTKSQVKWKTDYSIMCHALGPIFMTTSTLNSMDLLALRSAVLKYVKHPIKMFNLVLCIRNYQ